MQKVTLKVLRLYCFSQSTTTKRYLNTSHSEIITVSWENLKGGIEYLLYLVGKMSSDNRHGGVVRPQLCSLHTTEQQAAYHHTTKHRQHRLGVFSELDGCRLDAQAQVV